ncbi:hypothetical protein T552_01841 [Pneumocystis carinii B80]|uniref:Peptide transporter PTR2 n=1 Tax=Pneumocystis carinii (strain B80) TaxID=1408658 RepID=A0A0W4ZJN1_PNEC8|nr:hypothetical protein T552_01841 [Pneumocystis carinii B80]KTW28580.1 hypothetical protein T552_01841 [Pneumocystis carinii B80]
MTEAEKEIKEKALDQISLEEPTEEELLTLQRVSDKIPLSGYLVVAIELCERFSYYGLINPFQNYIQYKPTDVIPGALGLKQSGATALNSFFSLWSYLTPIFCAIIADQYLGRYWTIFWFSWVYLLGQIILILTSTPSAIRNGMSLWGFIVSIIIIGLGTGGIKVNVSPLVAEQYNSRKLFIKTLKNNQRVIVDYNVTLQHIFLIFYLAINIGSFGGVLTIFLEKFVGFWLAYLVPACVFTIGILILVMGKPLYICQSPQSSAILNAFKAIYIAIRSGFKLDNAKPSKTNGKYKLYWDDTFIDELRVTLVACRIFLFFPIYWLFYKQMVTNLLSQAGSMELSNLPSELAQQINPLTLVIMIPIFNNFIYPKLRKYGILLRPITRITIGFFCGTLAMGYSAIVQQMIYNSPPCYKYPGDITRCSAIKQIGEPNKIHLAYQLPSFVFIAISEIFSSITGLEYAYTKASFTMKSFVMSLFFLTVAAASVIQIIFSPLFRDPLMVWVYTFLSVASFVAGVVFWFLFKGYNNLEDEMNSFQRNIRNLKSEEFKEIENKPTQVAS